PVSYLSLLFARFFSSASPLCHYCYSLSLHDALPISDSCHAGGAKGPHVVGPFVVVQRRDNDRHIDGNGLGVTNRPDKDRDLGLLDRKSTRLNSSHQIISYAVFCLKKKPQPAGRERKD